ncbi:unnamed protein product, partial [Leptidea sinapis]
MTDPIPVTTEQTLSETNIMSSNNDTQNDAAAFVSQPSASYALASKKVINTASKTLPNTQNVRQPRSIPMRNNIWTQQTREMITKFNEGWRLLLIMRGAPGSGKSFKARELVQMTVGSVNESYHRHVFSTDDFFMCGGVYKFDKMNLHDAHLWNQNKAFEAMSKGFSPVIIDNTNIHIWDIEPYVKNGVKNGYLIYIVEPDTPWAKNAQRLFQKNCHNVPLHSIQRMLDNYEKITVEHIIKKYSLQYPSISPVFRNFPPIVENSSQVDTPIKVECEAKENNPNSDNFQNTNVGREAINLNTSNGLKENNAVELTSTTTINAEIKSDIFSSEVNNTIIDENYLEIQKSIEQFQDVEKQWDDGESWEDEPHISKPASSPENISELTLSKPQRLKETDKISEVEFPLTSFQGSNDWSQSNIPEKNLNQNFIVEAELPLISKKSTGTSTESGDSHISDKNPYKIITAIPRDINIFYINMKIEKIPEKRMFDKSTSTNNDILITEHHKYQYDEKEFRRFRKMFNKYSSSDLRDFYIECEGNVDWAVGLLIDDDMTRDSMAKKQLISAEEDYITSDDENEVKNVCLADYNIVPDDRLPSPEAQEVVATSSRTVLNYPKRLRKEANLSKVSMQLKRQIEKNIVISDSHYSENQLRLRKARYQDQHSNSLDDKVGEIEIVLDGHQEAPTKTEELKLSMIDTTNSIPNPFANMPCISIPAVAQENNAESDDEINTSATLVEETVNVFIGKDFIKQLDQMFGRKDWQYPETIKPNVNMPLSILSVINALWMESFTHQLDDECKQTAMIEQDAEFARQIASKEEEIARNGKEPDVPNLKELMDLETALSLYHKDIEKWREQEPSDLAAKLSREKLYVLFPDIDRNKTIGKLKPLCRGVNAQNCSDNSTIDLHYLHVPEALEALDLFLDIHIKKLREINGRNGVTHQTLFFITGRGLHSSGGPRIKPAVKRRLSERRI